MSTSFVVTISMNVLTLRFSFLLFHFVLLQSKFHPSSFLNKKYKRSLFSVKLFWIPSWIKRRVWVYDQLRDPRNIFVVVTQAVPTHQTLLLIQRQSIVPQVKIEEVNYFYRFHKWGVRLPKLICQTFLPQFCRQCFCLP